MITQQLQQTDGNGTLAPGSWQHVDAAPAADRQQSLPALLDDRLHGRWRIALVLGIIVGLGLAVVGYQTAPVRYTSYGSIHVAPAGNPILRQTFETETVPRYDSLLTTQAILVRSPRVIDHALRSQTLADLPIARDPNAQALLAKRLTARPERNSELITVAFEADSPTKARVVLTAILHSYDQIFGQRGSDFRIQRLTTLRDSRTQLRSTLAAHRRELQEFVSTTSHGVTDLTPLLHRKLLEIEDLKRDLARLEFDAQRRAAADDARSEGPDHQHEPTIHDLEAVLPELAAARLEHINLVAELKQAAEEYSEDHQFHRDLRHRLELIEERIASYERRARDKWLDMGLSGEPGAAAGGGLLTREIVAELIRRTQDELRVLNEEQARLTDYANDLADTEAELQEIDETIRLLEINSEALFSGSIHVAEEASRPQLPSRDRRTQMAGLGFCGGISASFGLFFLLGTIDRRTYGASQLRREPARYRFLGLLPDLGKGQLETERSEVAAQCVHQIRNRIEVLRPPVSSFVLAVTSPYQGDGKTSLALALGWSYAEAGHRVVLVDCDLIGRGLTRQMGLSSHDGLKNVLRNRALARQISDRPALGVDVLSAGLDPTIGPENIRRDDFKALCDELRRQYDVIIVDTGPFIGSIEMLPVVACADAAVFSVRRGRSRARLADCVDELTTVQIPTLGVVLNYAHRSDCNKYMSESLGSPRRLVADSAPGGPDSGAAHHADERNALVSAVQLVSQT